MRSSLRARRGAVLLDVILGTVLLTIAGIGFVTMLAQNFFTVAQLRERERELATASQQLERIGATWAAADFDAHVGTFRTRQLETRVQRMAPTLYAVSVADAASAVTLLTTWFYAVDTTDARR